MGVEFEGHGADIFLDQGNERARALRGEQPAHVFEADAVPIAQSGVDNMNFRVVVQFDFNESSSRGRPLSLPSGTGDHGGSPQQMFAKLNRIIHGQGLFFYAQKFLTYSLTAELRFSRSEVLSVAVQTISSLARS